MVGVMPLEAAIVARVEFAKEEAEEEDGRF